MKMNNKNNRNQDLDGLPFDRNMINQLANLDNATLIDAIRRIGSAAGATERQLNRVTGNIDKLKKKVMSMDDQDIRSLVEKFGEDNAADIVSQLKSEGLL